MVERQGGVVGNVLTYGSCVATRSDGQCTRTHRGDTRVGIGAGEGERARALFC